MPHVDLAHIDLKLKVTMDETQETHPLLSLISATFFVSSGSFPRSCLWPCTDAFERIVWLLTWVKASVSFLLLSLIRWTYAILSYSFTLTVSLSTRFAI